MGTIPDFSTIPGLRLIQSRLPTGDVVSKVLLAVKETRVMSRGLNRADLLAMALWMVQASKVDEKMEQDSRDHCRTYLRQLRRELDSCDI